MEKASERPVDFRIFRDVDCFEATYSAGTAIQTPNDPGRMMYIIAKGVVAVQVENVTVEQICEGGIFGEMGVVDHHAHTASIVAVTDVTLFALTEQQFLRLIGAKPTFALRVMRVLAQRIRNMNSRLVDLPPFANLPDVLENCASAQRL